MTELSITVRDSDQSLTQKHLIHDTQITLSHQDETLKSLVEAAIQDFHGQHDEVFVKARFEW